MPPELRKRKAPESAPAPAPKKKNPVSKAVAKVKEVLTGSPKSSSKMAEAPAAQVAVGDVIDLATFGGEIQTHAGVKTTLKALVEESKSGVVLFTYPKASTPGCTTQACLFRDSYAPLTSTGLSIYGLSADSPSANTNFKEKQSLPYPLLCDPNFTLISAIGLKSLKGTARGVFVVDKAGKVLAKEQGGPQATVDVVQGLVGSSGATAAPAVEPETAKEEAKPAANGINGGAPAAEPTKEDVDKANVAADVADTAEKLDNKGTTVA